MTARLRAEALEHLWRHFPNHCIILTDPQSRRFIDLGIARAASHGFISRDDVCSYLSLMVFLGSYFDEDPQWPWAPPLLGGGARMDDLFEIAVRAVEPVIGRDGEHYRRALLRARAQLRSLPRPNVDALLQSIERGAQEYGLRSHGGSLTLGVIMLLLGSGAALDPLHPWIARVLGDPALPGDVRAAALHAEALSQLDRYMAMDRYMRAN
jgi:hypothetical protein